LGRHRFLVAPKFRANSREHPNVDLALKLNVQVVCAVFLFVGAILMGAF
jgi:hypothetical protein